MYPYLLPEVFGYSIPMYDLMIVIGCLLMLGYVGNRLEKKDNLTRQQANKILVLLVVSLFGALGFSYLFDAVFHTIQEGEITHGSITFLGGLIGGLSSFLILYRIFLFKEDYTLRTIMNTIIVGVVLAHAFGRIGCTMAGCCHGIPTDSFLGVKFPYGHASELYPNQKVFPTQTFESIFLFCLFFGMNKIKNIRYFEMETYLIGYGIWRFLIEFIRGDERGEFITLFTTEYNSYPSPSQFMSLGLIILGIILLKRHQQKEKTGE